MAFNPQGLATAIGSMPHSKPSDACDIILDALPEIPIWPQLPNTNFREEMEIQYSEGIPCVVLDEEKKRMFFETEKDITSDFEVFYENYMAENLEHFKISDTFSRGIPEMEKKLAEKARPELRYFKNHVTGPITVGLGRVDENKRVQDEVHDEHRGNDRPAHLGHVGLLKECGDSIHKSRARDNTSDQEHVTPHK